MKGNRNGLARDWSDFCCIQAGVCFDWCLPVAVLKTQNAVLLWVVKERDQTVWVLLLEINCSE